MSERTISRRVRGLPRSGVRETMELALRTKGAIRLDIGDPDFHTPAHIVEAAARAANAHVFVERRVVSHWRRWLFGDIMSDLKGLPDSLTLVAVPGTPYAKHDSNR